MIESEYVKSIVRKIAEDKRSRNIVPEGALLGEIDKVVCEDTLNCLRQLYKAEKLERINSLRKNEAKVKGESMKDSLYDLANYAILTIMELEKTEK